MTAIYPFRAVLPTPEKVSAVASPPYDVVSFEEARSMAAADPCCFIRVLRAEVDLPSGTDPYGDEVYQQAGKTYRDWRRQGILQLDTKPSLYVYSLLMEGHRQTGLAALCTVDDYQRNLVRKHEHTRPDKEGDRTRHISALNAQTGLVFLTCPDNVLLEKLINQVAATEPLFDFTADDGIRHTLWRVPSDMDRQLCGVVKDIPVLYIADGHHRAAAAARVREEKRSETPGYRGDEAYNRFPVVIFPAGQLRILPYNRVVKGLNGFTPPALLQRCGEHFSVTVTDISAPEQRGDIHMYLDGDWYCLRLRRQDQTASASPVDQLDVSLLQNLILSPLLGIEDPRKDQRIDFVGGIRGVEELTKRVDSGLADLAFSLFPTTVEQLMQIADVGSVMPPKSTWFEPKLRDGLLVHELD